MFLFVFGFCLFVCLLLRSEIFEKAEKEEEREKAIFARFVCLLFVFGLITNMFFRAERNRRWRARREDGAAGKNEDEDDDDDEEKDEKEKRKKKNKEWRERRSTSNSQVEVCLFV